MRILITAGPTREPIDPVRFIGNRSSGKMGIALAQAALDAKHSVTLILGPVAITTPPAARRIDIETAQQMLDAVRREFPDHDLLIMTAAVADYRPRIASENKISRDGALTLELEPTEDIIAGAGQRKRTDQRTIGFSLETASHLERARRKLQQKHLDLIVYNPAKTIDSDHIEPTLLYPDGREEKLPSRPKRQFADILIQRAGDLFP
jgi:phosphopantothenoylcysteine decarboxylase / phosphopantothenate---cysteine ligase